MNEEKMMILKMLEQGKITSTEAAKLLEALKESKGTNSFSHDLSKKVEVFSKDLEPKIKKVTKTLLGKTADIADKISKSLNQSLGNQEKKIELKVSYNENIELRLKGKNGKIYIKGYNGDKITANIKYNCKSEKDILELIEVGSVVYLNYDEKYFDKIEIEAFIPEKVFKKIYIETTNNDIYVDGLESKEAYIYTYNGIIETKQCNIEKMELITSNSEIILDASKTELNSYNFYEWRAETSNGGIKVRTINSYNIGYDIEASTVLNGIQVNLSNIDYKENKKNYIKGISSNYSIASKKIKLNLQTTNAPIIIS
ncbi:SHOCT-like domain-containing protein [Defluviitalea phaphyphila]|uniref:SHOCT-like domain-containing protein n=1 Tax=Defluviitalea phaphyphila TaxID=1473580 RepID=UPI00072FF41A|nr:hypothetical protein [Defluviitalea phaphyphila]